MSLSIHNSLVPILSRENRNIYIYIYKQQTISANHTPLLYYPVINVRLPSTFIKLQAQLWKRNIQFVEKLWKSSCIKIWLKKWRFVFQKENIMLLYRVRQNDHPLYLYGKWQVLQILVVRIPCTYAVTSGSHSDLIGRKKS